MEAPANRSADFLLDRYLVHGAIAAGGMATIHIGKLRGAAGFERLVAVKRLHAHYAMNPEFVAMFTDEARLAARIHHPNVVTTLDVVTSDGELFVVMEYIHGQPLYDLVRAAKRRGARLPAPVVSAIVGGSLQGLHAAHEAKDEHGAPLDIVHRDVSPQNVLVGADGIARVLDFGIARAAGRAHVTQDGAVKGKFAYMPPEQLHGERVDRRADIYAAGVVLWESITAERLFLGSDDALDLARLLRGDIAPPSSRVAGLPAGLDEIVMKALSQDASHRYATAREMALALSACVPPALPSEVGAWVEELCGAALSARMATIRAMGQAPLPSVVVGPTGRGASQAGQEIVADETTRDKTRVLPLDTHTVVMGPAGDSSRAGDAPISRVGAAGIAGVALLAGGLLAFALFGFRGASETQSLAAAQAGSPRAAGARVDEVTSARGADLPAQEPSAAPLESVPNSIAAPAETASAALPRPAPQARSAACDPPYTIDDRGHKRYKRECFGEHR